MSERQGVEIDYCPKCRGVWLDRGELDKILERSAAELAPPAPAQTHTPPSPHAPRHDDPYRGEGRRYDDDRDHDKKRRKKSFLEELFD